MEKMESGIQKCYFCYLQSENPNMRYLLLTGLLFSVTFNFAQVPAKNEAVQHFDEILTYINRLYVDDVDNKKLFESAINGMLETLDPHSTYIPKEDAQSANERINGSFVGVGIRFQIMKDTLMVVETIPGGPSEKIGIQAGDKFIRIGDELVAGTGLKNSQVRTKLMGELGSKVKVEVIRNNARKPLKFTITRDKIPVTSVDCAYMITPETGYIKLNSFSKTTTEEIDANIQTLKSKGMKNLILDLQDNGGGLLYTAKDLADNFLSSNKLIVYSEGRSQPRLNLNAGQKGLWETGKLIILTNENSASASEIVSGAIQDWDRGLIVGRRTFGKGLVQKPIALSDGGELRLTIAKYYTPTGRWIQKPYTDLKAYKNDYLDRYLHGEFTNQDSIKFPDSLKYSTLITKRTVYGGGGIMPDVFVPLDTSDVTEYYKGLVRGGHFNNFSLTYAQKNRAKIKTTYKQFADFKAGFNCDKKFMDEFFDYVKKEQPDLAFNEADYKISEKSIQLRLKALLARDIWSNEEFYEIYNDANEILQAALKVIESSKYDSFNLDKGN